MMQDQRSTQYICNKPRNIVSTTLAETINFFVFFCACTAW